MARTRTPGRPTPRTPRRGPSRNRGAPRTHRPRRRRTRPRREATRSGTPRRPARPDPLAAFPGDAEVDRDEPAFAVGRIDAERAAEHEARVVGRAHVHELTGLRTERQV